MSAPIEWGGTAGPWHVDGLMIAPNHAVCVCTMVEFDSFGGHHEAPSWEANARAIAEVPAMVALLRSIVSASGVCDYVAFKTGIEILERIDAA